VKTLLLLLFAPILMNGQETETSEVVNPARNWFFGVEIGQNTITSFSFGEQNKSFQGGVLAEYYTGRHWSLTGRVKYFKTGLSFFQPNTHSGSWFDLGHDPSFGQFEGDILTFPINIKWEFLIHKNFRGSLNLGTNYAIETKSNYYYSENKKSNYAKDYWGTNIGFGCIYFISKKTGVFVDVESYLGGYKGNSDGFIFSKSYYTTNTLVNFGFKYNFKKQ
jgi:Outer membrane protein beta-barrel domain